MKTFFLFACLARKGEAQQVNFKRKSRHVSSLLTPLTKTSSEFFWTWLFLGKNYSYPSTGKNFEFYPIGNAIFRTFNLKREKTMFENESKMSVKTGGVYLPGDIIIGGLFPVHNKPKTNANDKMCGDKVYDRGIQRLEAMLYAIDKINSDNTILK